MRIYKNDPYNAYLKEARNAPFVCFYNQFVSFSSAARDAILPHEYVFVDVDVERSQIVFTPTNDAKGYKITKTGCQIRTSCRRIEQLLPVELKKRYYGEVTSDGKVLITI